MRERCSMAPYRIVLANDHMPLREGLKRILRERTDLEITGEAENRPQLLNCLSLRELAPHMVILDPSMPDLRGTEAIRQIKAIRPDVKVLILSMHKGKEYLSKAIFNGAEGYLLKEDVDKELLAAIEVIRQGRIYVPPFP